MRMAHGPTDSTARGVHERIGRMSTRLRDALTDLHTTLRHEPIDKRIRGVLGGETVIDSSRALLVWEPKRVVPDYAFPVEDVHAELVPADGDASAAEPDGGPAMSGLRSG